MHTTVIALLLATLIGAAGCEKAQRPSTGTASQPSEKGQPPTYVLRPLRGDPSAVKFIHGREPVRDVVIDVKDGWRSISADKWTGSNVAYFAAKDLGAPVENRVRDNADFTFDLRWRLGDLASMNAALERYGVEIIAAEQAVPSTQSRQ
jgi:hypothetical protein